MSTYTLTYTSKLTEDYIHSAEMLAAGGAVQPLACFLNSSNQSEALLIHDDGELCHLMRDPLSSSGWNIIGIGAQINNIVAANSSAVWMIDTDQSVWMSNAGHWNPIGFSDNSNGGGGLNIAIDIGGSVYATGQQDGQTIQYTYDPVTGQLSKPTPVNYLTPPVGGPGNQWVIVDGGVLTNAYSSDFEEFQGLLGPNETPSQLFGTSDGTIWMISNQGNIYNPDNDGVDWDSVNVPDQCVSFAPVNQNLFYALCGASSAFTLYSCDGNGNNTDVSQPQGRPLGGISVGLDGTLWGYDNIGCVWRMLNGVWVRMIQPTDLSGFTGGHTVTEIVTGRHALGSQYAFFIEDSKGDLRFSQFLEEEGVFGGYWNDGGNPATGCSCLGVVNDPITNQNLIAYCVNSDGNFIVVQNQGGSDWKATTYKMKTPLAGTRPIFNTYNGKWMTYAVIDQKLYWGDGGLDSPAPELAPATGSPSLGSIIPFSTIPNGTESPMMAAIDTSNQLWVFTTDGKNVTFTQMSGLAIGSAIGSVMGVSCMTDSNSSARIYAHDENDMLWIIRQTAGVWSEWHPLGNDCKVMGVGCTFPALNAPFTPPVDLFSLDTNFEVNVLSEDPTTGALSDLVMLKPAGTNEDAEYVTRYVTEVTICDENSLPQANFAIAVSADQAVGIWVGNNAYTITPSTTVQLTTDQHGILRFAFFAMDLHTPTFSFMADGLDSPPTIYPAQEVNDYLRNNSSVETLGAAQMQTQPDWAVNATTPFISASVPPANVGPAATALAQAYTVTLDPSAPSGQYSVVDSTGNLVSGSSFWHDLCNFPHDIEHAVRKAALSIESVAVDVENQAITLGMTLANGATQLMKLAIHAVEDVVSAVKSVFRFVGRAVDDAIHWLKSLFAWSDVINTKRVFEAGLSGLMSRLAVNMHKTSPYYLGTLFDNFWTADVIADVKAAYGRASQHFAPGQSFSQVSSQAPFPSGAAPAGGDALHPNNASSAQTSNSTQTNYVTGHVKTYGSNGGTFPPGSQNQGAASGMMNAYTQNSGAANVNSVGSTLQGLFSDPKAFADVVMYDVIQGLETTSLAVLDVIEDIVNVLIAGISDAFSAFQTMLTNVIDIPVISWLYKQISGGDPLTILDLACLMMAVPTTIVYKLTFGMPNATAPFSKSDVSAMQSMFGPGNFPWPPEAGGTAATTGALGSFPLGGAGAIMMVLNMVTYGIFDVFNDLEAYSGFQTPAPAGAEPDPATTFLSVGSLISTMIGQWLTAPYSIFGQTNTKARQMTAALWGLNFLPVLTGILFMIDSLKLGEYQYAGVGVNCFTGLLLFAYGVGVSVNQAEDSNKEFNVLYQVQNGLAPIPSALKPLVTVVQQYQQPAGAIAAGFLVGADIAFDGANGILAFCEDLS